MGKKKTRGQSSAIKAMAWGKSAAKRLIGTPADANDAADAPPAIRRKPILETLEPRLLLSTSPLPQPAFNATLKYDNTTGLSASSVVLELVDTGAANLTLQLRNTATNAVLGQETLDEDVRVSFTGSVFNDKLTINLNYADADGNPSFAPHAIKIDFDGGFDVPTQSDDQLVIQSSGAQTYVGGGLFIKSTDDVVVGGTVKMTGDIDIEAADVINVNAGANVTARDIRLASIKASTGRLPGTDIQANAASAVNLLGASLTGRNIGIDATSTVTIDSQDKALFGGQVKLGAVDANASAAITLSGANVVKASGTLAFDAASVVTSKLVTAPDATSTASNKDASVAVTHVGSTATVLVGGTSALTATGALTIAADNTVGVQTIADGGAGAQGGSALGGTVAVTVIGGDTRTDIANSASLTGGSIALSANANRTADTQAKSTKGGATSGGATPTTGQQTLTQQKAGTSDGSMQLAAAVAVSTITGDAVVEVSTAGKLATTGALGLAASNTIAGPVGGLTTIADGTNTQSGGTAIAAAAAIDLVDATARVAFTGATQIAATAGATALATATTARTGAQATSGAGGTGTGVAGALAIHSGVVQAEALLTSSANLVLSGGTALALRSVTLTSDTARATSKVDAGGNSVGVGASVAIDIADNTSRAVFENGSQIAGAGALVLDAKSNNTVTTTALGGSAGGTAITPVAAITVGNSDTIADVLGAPVTLVAGNLSATADHAGTAATNADGAAKGSSFALGMAVASGIVQDHTRAQIDRSLTLGGSLNVTANSKQGNTATAKASARGGKEDDGASNGKVDQAGAAQRGVGDTTATNNGGRTSAGAGNTPSATTADGNGGSGSSSVGAAGAVAIDLATTVTTAHIGDGRSIVSGGAINLKSSADSDAMAGADGQATVAANNTGIGAAVAINAADVTSKASIGSSSVTGFSVTVSAAMADANAQDVFLAQSVSGAGGGKVGVAGSVAINIGSVLTDAQIATGAVVNQTGGGSVNVIAGSKTQDTASAKPGVTSGTSFGLGASAAINVIDETTHAHVDSGAALTAGGSVGIAATSANVIVTDALAGASGGTTVVPVAAVTVANLDTVAEALGTGAFGVGGTLSIGATHAGSATTSAVGNSSATGKAFGASVAVGVVSDNTTALLDRNVTVGALAITATSQQLTKSSAVASAKGGDSTKSGNAKGVDDQNTAVRGSGDSAAASRGQRDSSSASSNPQAATADTNTSNSQSGSSSIAIAGAAVVNVADSTTRARIGGGHSVVATGAVNLLATANTDAGASADASAVATSGDASIGVAVAINVADITHDASIGAGSSVQAQALAVRALQGGAEASPDFSISAAAVSGAGSKKVGVAGSLAINVVDSQHTADIAGTASVQLAGGALTVRAFANTTVDAAATPRAGGVNGGSAGIGASVALNVVDTAVTARINDGATLAGTAAGVLVEAAGAHNVKTKAKAGAAAGDGVGVGAGVAIALADNETTAWLGSGSQLNASGAVSVHALHAALVQTEADASGTGTSAGVGVSVGINLIGDTVTAHAGRSVVAVGDITVAAEATSISASLVTGSAQGNADGGRTADQESDNQVNNNPNNGGDRTVPNAQSSTDQGSSKSGTESGSKTADVGVGAAVSVTSLKVTNSAEVAPNAHLSSSGGNLSVNARADVDASTVATGSAVDLTNTTTGIGAAVGITVATVANSASVGSGAVLGAKNISINAGNLSGSRSDFTTTALSAGGGKDNGFAGSVAVNVVDYASKATVGGGATLTSAGALSVAATSNLGIQAFAAGAGIGQKIGIGVAVAINVVDNTTLATVQTGATLDAAGATQIAANATVAPDDFVSDVPLLPNKIGLTSMAMGVGAGQNSVGIAGSLSVNVFDLDTEARLDDNVKVNQNAAAPGIGQSVQVTAKDSTSITSAAGAIGVSTGNVGIGLAVDVGVISKLTRASVGRGAQVKARGDIAIGSDSIEDIVSAAASIAASDGAGIAGSVSVQVLNTQSRAGLDDGTAATPGANVAAQGNVGITANGRLDSVQVAGTAAFGTQAGVGLSNTTLVHTDTVEASLGDRASVTTQGSAGLTVAATSAEDVYSIAAGGAGGGTAGVAASASITVLDETTRARIGDGVSITAAALAGSTNRPGVSVRASDDTQLLAIGGAIAGGGSAGVGAGVSVASVGKTTEAGIGSGVNAQVLGNLVVESLSTEDLVSVAAAGGAGGSAGIAGAAGVLVADIDTQAFIGAGDVHATGSIAVNADDGLDITNVAGSIGVGGSAGVGAAVGVPVVTKHVNAFIGTGARVTADGQTALDVSSGAFGIGFTAAPAAPANAGLSISNGNRPTAADAKFGPSGSAVGSYDFDGDSTTAKTNVGSDGLLAGVRQATVGTDSGFRGLAVTATNHDNVKNFVVSVAAGGAAGVSVAAGVNVFDEHTQAFIADGAKVNESTAGASAAQSVKVAAATDFYDLDVAGSVAIGGAVGAAPAVGVTVLTLDTQATIGANALVQAKDDVVVDATANENFVLIGAGIGGGFVGVGGAITVPVLTDITHAGVGPGATLRAGGDAAVMASDDTKVLIVSGSVGAGAVGVGASVGVLSLSKETSANIGAGAKVDAAGNGSGIAGVLDGSASGTTSLGKAAAHGVVVQATSSEDVTHIAVAAGGGFVGIAGGVAVTVIESATGASIDAGAQINQFNGNAGANAAQAVTVRAGNVVDTLSFAGAIAGGAVGVAGAVDVGNVRNDTSATVAGGGTQVTARGKVAVGADHLSHNTGYTLSAGGGFVGVGAAVSVWSVGTSLKDGYADGKGGSNNALTVDYAKRDAANPNGVAAKGQADGMAASQVSDQSAGVGSLMGGYQQSATSDGHGVAESRLAGIGASASAGIVAKGPTGQSLNARIKGGQVAHGTQATVAGGATVHAGGDIVVEALDRSQLDFLVGGLGVGFVGVGAGIGVLNVSNNARASSAGVLAAGGNISIDGKLDEDIKQRTLAFSGGAVAVGASVSVISDDSTDQAYIDKSGVVSQAASLQVGAATKQTLATHTDGISVGAIGVGVSYSVVTVGNSAAGVIDTYAAIRDGAQIGQGGAVGNVTVKATSEITASIDTVGVAAGAIAVNVNFATVNVAPDIKAEIGNGAHVTSTDQVAVLAGTDHSATANVFGLTGGLLATSAGVSKAMLNPDVTASVGGEIDAAGLTVTAAHNRDLANFAAKTRGAELAGANARTTAPSIGFASLSYSSSSASSTASVLAEIRDNAFVNISGAIALRATGLNSARARGVGFSLGAIGLGAIATDSTASGDATARLGSKVTAKGASLGLLADDVDHAQSDTETTDIGLFELKISAVKATTTPTVTAEIGAGANITTTGNVAIQALSTTDADANAHGVTVGLIGAASKIESTSTVTPTVSALVQSSAALPSTITAGGSVAVEARHGVAVAVPDGAIGTLNTGADTLVTTVPHGLQTGDLVQYQTGGNAAIGGLVADKSYGVIVIDAKTIKLGNPFKAKDVDATLDTIRFASPHNFKSGDKMIYGVASDGNGVPAVIGGLVNGATYYVRVIDATTIKLTTTPAGATQALQGFQPSALDANTDVFTLAGNGFSDGQAVTYRAPPTTQFFNSAIDAAGNVIYLPAPAYGAALQTNDLVVYHATAGGSGAAVPLGGLVNNQAYFVKRLNAQQIQLSTTPITANSAGTIVDLSVVGGVNAAQTAHGFSRSGAKAITGLNDGVTYYVKRIDADHFQLAAQAGGAALNLNNAGVAGTQFIGVEGIDLKLNGTPAGQQYLARDLTGALAGAQAVSGPAALNATGSLPGIDGVSSATSIGASISLGVGSQSTTSTINLTATVSASVGAAAHLSSSGDLSVAALAFGSAEGETGSSAGGIFGGLGDAKVNINLNQTVTTTIGAAAALDAGGKLAVTSENRHVAFGTAYAGGGAAGIASTGGFTSITALPTTITEIAAGALLHAAGDMTIAATMGAKGKATGDSAAYSAVGSGGSTSASWNLGSSGLPQRQTAVFIDANAQLTSDKTLALQAVVNDTRIDATATASAVSVVYASPDSFAGGFMSSHTLVYVATGARLTGTSALNLLSEHNGVSLHDHAYSDGGSVFGGPDATASMTLLNYSDVTSDAGSTFLTGKLNVEANVRDLHTLVSGDAVGFTLNPFDQPSWNGDYTLQVPRTITFNGDVVLLASPAPKLVINADGSMTQQGGVTATISGNQINVGDIVNTGVGTARLAVNSVAAYLPGSSGVNLSVSGINGVIQGTQGTYTVRHSYETVDIVNHSTKDLVIHGIDPIDRTKTATVRIEASLNSYGFKIVHDYAPTAISIVNDAPTGAADVVLDGVIDNPIGSTRVVANRGDIIGTANHLIRSNTVNLEAALNIGSVPIDSPSVPAAGRIVVDLVASKGRPTDLNAKAGGNIVLSLGLLDRVAPQSHVLNAGVIDAGQDVDILLRAARVQTVLGGAPSGYVIQVIEAQDGNAFATAPVNYSNHYKPDGGGPAFAAPIAVFGTGSTLEDSSAVFGLLRAGGNIKVHAAFGTSRIDIKANTDITGSGHVDVDTNGNIALTETVGDLRLGSVISLEHDLALTAPDSIVDALADTAADVSGNNISFSAVAGSVGSFYNDVEIDSAYSGAGMLAALAGQNVYVWETRSGLTIDSVVAQTGDVRLTTKDSQEFSAEDIVVGTGRQVVAGLGMVALQAGDAIRVGLNGKLKAGGQLALRTDFRNADTAGGLITTRGANIDAFSILAEGDSEADDIDLSAANVRSTVYGYGGNDSIRGSQAADQLYGGDGVDAIFGNTGDDLIVAGTGIGDQLNGNDGNDTIYGSSDGGDIDANWIDTLRFGDVITGGDGNDTIYGQGGADDIDGGAGSDLIDAGAGNDRVSGGLGADVIYGHLGDDEIYGFYDPALPNGADDAASDTLYGEWGNDKIWGGAGADLIDGGFGDDTIRAGAGDDIVQGGYGNNFIFGQDGNDQLIGSDDGVDGISGGKGDDRIDGKAGNDTLMGDEGRDQIDGGAGDDIVIGGAGADVLVGGANNDQLYGDSLVAQVDDNAVDYLYGDFGTGKDEAGSGADRLFGQGGNDLLFGEGGDDFIGGSAGFNQTEAGGGASNVIDFGDATDTSSFAVPAVTAAPPVKAIDYTENRAAISLPDQQVQNGRWADLGHTADGKGLSGGLGLSTDPAVTVGASGQFAAWTDTRSGNPQVFVAQLVNGKWVQLGGSASGDALGAGVTHTVTAASNPSIVLDASGAPIVVWTAEHNGQRDIRAARFDGTNWVAIGGSLGSGGISNTGLADKAQVVMTAGGPVVVWLDGAAGAKTVYARAFQGGAWVEMGGIASATGSGLISVVPSALPLFDVADLAVASDGSRVAVSWSLHAGTGAVRNLYLREFSGGTAGVWTALNGGTSANGAGFSPIADPALEGVASHNAQTSLSYFGGRLFVAWQTFSDQGQAIAVADFENSAGRTLVLRDTLGLAYGKDLPALPTLSAGGGTLRLVWAQTLSGGAITEMYATRWNGAHFVEEIPTEASGQGLSVTGGNVTRLAVATDASGRSTVLWQDASSGQPEIYARGMSATVARTFVADISKGVTVQSILDANDLGAGDAIIAIGKQGGVVINADDAGVAIYGSAGSTLASVTVQAGANNVLLSRVAVEGRTVVNGADGFTITESQLSGVQLNGGSNAQVTYNTILFREAGSAIELRGAVVNALIDHNQASGLKILPPTSGGSAGAVNLTVSNNRLNATGFEQGPFTMLEIGVQASGRIRDNVINGGTIGLDIARAFGGLIDGNTIAFGQTGVSYRAPAALIGNTISGIQVGVQTSVAGTVNGLGFVAGSGYNTITGSKVGIVALNAQFQWQIVIGNQTGATGSGIVGGSSLARANVFANNAVGVTLFSGTVQYSRFIGNTVAIDVIASMSGLKVQHDVFFGNTTAGVRLTGATDVQITQNTFYSASGDNIRLQGGSARVNIVGNILWADGAGYDIYVANDSQAGFASDYNNLYKTGAGKLVYWTKDFSDVLDWQADVARFDLHSIGATVVNPDWARPRFTDIHRGDLTLFDTFAGLRFTSPDIGLAAAGSALNRDLGAYGGTAGSVAPTARKIMLRWPDMYTDWEVAESLPIRWETVNNTGGSLVRIDLLQDTPDGPKFVANITAGTADDGEFVWNPGASGIPFGTNGLRIQISLVQAPEVIDRSQETFNVPESGNQYYVDDQSNANDVFTPGAIGNNRNTGKTPDAPKPNPVNLLRAYELKAGDTLFIDSGDYPMIYSLVASATQDLTAVAGAGMGHDTGFTVTGPLNPAQIASLFPAIPGDRTRALVDLIDADNVSINHLTLKNANRGLYVHGGSDGFSASYVTASNNLLEGMSIATEAPNADFDHLVATGNGGDGVNISGNVRALTNSTASGNAGDGIEVAGGIRTVSDNVALGNNGWGLRMTRSGPVQVLRNQITSNVAGGINLDNAGAVGVATIGDADLTHNAGNIVSGNGGAGIVARHGVAIAGNTVSGQTALNAWGIYAEGQATVTSNLVYQNNRGLYVGDGTATTNRVYANANEGLAADASDVIGNVVYSNAIGLRLTDLTAKLNVARNNLVYGNSQVGVTIAGDKLSFMNNTVWQELGDAVRLAAASNVGLFDNILMAANGKAIAVTPGSNVGFQSDYNLFTPTFSGTIGQWQGVTLSTLASWTATSGNDAHSVFANPLFESVFGADGKLGFVSLAQDGRDDDFHEMSIYGGFRSGSLAPVRGANGLPQMQAPLASTNTTQQSPAIDAGRPGDAFGNEPAFNGSAVNLGAYGNTAQAGRSRPRIVLPVTLPVIQPVVQPVIALALASPASAFALSPTGGVWLDDWVADAVPRKANGWSITAAPASAA